MIEILVFAGIGALIARAARGSSSGGESRELTAARSELADARADLEYIDRVNAKIRAGKDVSEHERATCRAIQRKHGDA